MSFLRRHARRISEVSYKAVATKELFIPVSIHSANTAIYDAAVNSFPISVTGAAEGVNFAMKVPSDFSSLSKAVVVCIPDATETIQWDVLISVAAIGETGTGTQDTSASNVSVAATNDTLVECNVAGGMTGIAANDFLGVEFQSDTTDIRVLGLHFVYVPTG